MQTMLSRALLAAAVLWPVATFAQHAHEGDVQPAVVSGQIVLPSSQSHGATGGALFEGDFGDLVKGPYKTSSPGFNSFAFAAGTIVNYTAVGSLSYFDGLSWSSTVPSVEYVRLDGNGGEDSRWTTAGASGDLTGLIGQVSATGELHEHLDFSVVRAGGGTPAAGAYLIQLQLSAEGYGSSDPFYLVFNRGLSSAAFESGVGALTAPVPEPETWALMLAGLGLVSMAVRRRQVV